MSQSGTEITKISPEAPMPLGGQVQPVDGEGGMIGFTAVNGRGSPQSQAQKQVIAEAVRDETSQTPRGISQRPATDSEAQAPQSNGAERQLPSTPPMNGHLKRKRSVVDVDDDQSSDASDRSSNSPSNASPDVQMQDSSGYHRQGDPQDESAWNGQPGDEQAEHLRMLAPIQQENQQHLNGNYATNPQLQNGQGLRPGYHKDENTGLITTNAGVQMDPKKRKRAFTNRTKTGCQTCRRRKKKCDEAKPECNNCTRGGFRCEGYTPRVSWPPDNKSKGAKQALPPSQGMPPTPRELQEFSGNLHPRPPPRPEGQQYMDMQGPGQPMRPRPMTLDDEPDRQMSNGWNHSPMYPPPHRGYSMDNKEPVHGLPTHGMRESYDRPMSSMSGSSMHTMHSAHSMAPQPTLGIIGTAQQALRYQPPVPPQPTPQMSPYHPLSRGDDGERQRLVMLSGDLYMPSAEVLKRDRERCASLLHGFNTKHLPTVVSRMQELSSLLTPLGSSQQLQDGSSQARSSNVSANCDVNVPFRCDYGYNIKLGTNVTIESGCHIADPREVFIDDFTHIGPGVKILGSVFPLDPSVRANGIERKARGFEIHIGPRVYIGANTVIQPDETLCPKGRLEIGHGSYIKPGSIVNKSVPPDVVYGPSGSGCDVLSGTGYSSSADNISKGRSR